jgi:hypothetical protein
LHIEVVLDAAVAQQVVLPATIDLVLLPFKENMK